MFFEPEPLPLPRISATITVTGSGSKKKKPAIRQYRLGGPLGPGPWAFTLSDFRAWVLMKKQIGRFKYG